LRWAEPQGVGAQNLGPENLGKTGVDGEFDLIRMPHVATLATNVPSKRSFHYPPMNSGCCDGLELHSLQRIFLRCVFSQSVPLRPISLPSIFSQHISRRAGCAWQSAV
jgi:hypothetical protein